MTEDLAPPSEPPSSQRKLFKYSVFLIPPLAALTVLGVVLLQRDDIPASTNLCKDDNCVMVNDTPIYDVMYRGQIIPIEKIKTMENVGGYSSIAPVSASLGYFWVFDTKEEALDFDKTLVKMEKNCWVQGTCTKQLENGKPYRPYSPSPSPSESTEKEKGD